MEKKKPSPTSHLELLIPDKKREKQKEAHPEFTEEELIRNEAWHGVTHDAPKRQPAKLISPEAERARRAPKKQEEPTVDTADILSTREQTVLDSEYVPDEKKMTVAELREAREQEEQSVESIALHLFEQRMQGVDAEGIDRILAEKGIKPWTSEAEEFMRTWDWEQAENIFNQLAQEREQAVLRANEAEPKKRVVLQEYQAEHVSEKFAAFNIDPDALPEELRKEFETLTFGQRLLLAENLHQLTLGRVQEEALQKFHDDTKQAKFLGRIWRGVTKKYQIAKHEQATASQITQGGMEYHGELLKQLVEGTKRTGLDAIEGKNGALELQYVEAHPLMTERQKEEAKEFNRIATQYAKVPYEWSLATATASQKKEYERMHAQFEKAKEHILKTEQGIIGDEDSLLFFADIENKIRLNQFFNTHPDAEKQLQSIESDAVWSKAIANTVTERGMYFGAGLATRTFATGLLGAVGFPLAAVGMGGWLARKRAAETLRERERSARRGTKDTSKEARATVTADQLTDKLESLVKKINGETDETKRAELIDSLRVRLEYTQNKLGTGAVDFGSVDRRIVNQYGLMDALTMGSSTLVVQDVELGRVPARFERDTRGRLEQFMQFKDEKVTKAQKDYLRKQMIYGAGLGVAAFSVGYYAKDVLYGVAPTESHASSVPGSSVERAGVPGAAAHAQEAAGTTPERAPIVLDIGTRGPEGAFIDELRKHPEIAQRLGIKDIGKEAHAAWAEFAKKELKDPETLRVMRNLGYPKTMAGYGEMMRHIDNGKIMLEERGGKLHMRIDEDTEYLQARSGGVAASGARGAEDIPTTQQTFGEAPAAAPEAQLPFDADKAFREQPIEGITSPIPRVEKPTIALEVLIENQFGLDGEEYAAIKGVRVEELLKQIPSRDEAWAIWRGEVPGKEITLPHDGIYGAMEFKKHIDLAEHIREARPSENASHDTVDAFMKNEMRDKGFRLTEQGIASDRAASSVEAVAAEAPASSGVAAVEDVPTKQQIMEPTSRIEGIAPETFALLNDDVYNSKMPVQKIITQYKVGNISADDFARYYSEKVSHAKPSAQIVESMKKTFSEAAGEGTAQQRLTSQRALELMVQRLQGLK